MTNHLDKKFFVSGAYSGHEDEARAYFQKACDAILEKFPLASVFDPTKISIGLPYSAAMSICCARIKGWATDIAYVRNQYYDGSKGSLVERKLAQEKGLGEYVFRDGVLSELPKED